VGRYVPPPRGSHLRALTTFTWRRENSPLKPATSINLSNHNRRFTILMLCQVRSCSSYSSRSCMFCIHRVRHRISSRCEAEKKTPHQFHGKLRIDRSRAPRQSQTDDFSCQHWLQWNLQDVLFFSRLPRQVQIIPTFVGTWICNM
jgi:hypothetical protein